LLGREGAREGARHRRKENLKALKWAKYGIIIFKYRNI